MANTDAPAPDWSHEPLEESLTGARALTVSVVDRTMRGWWEQLAWAAGVPPRRWQRHHPIGVGPLVTLVDGEPAMDATAWNRFASLVPGAVALPSRTAAALDVSRDALKPPARAPLRLVDLAQARRARARLRRAERHLDGDLATFRARLEADLDAALADGDAGIAFTELPGYALAARLEQLVGSSEAWRIPAVIDFASGDATARLLAALLGRGMRPGQALLTTARLQAGGGIAPGAWMQQLAVIAEAPSEQRSALLTDALVGLTGWHATRELLLESEPLRETPEAVRTWIERLPRDSRTHAVIVEPPDDELHDLVIRARRLAALREQVARDRARLHAGLRALSWTLARRLVRDQQLTAVELAFDLELDALLRLARGAFVPHVPTIATPNEPADLSSVLINELPAPSAETLVRGIPASAGRASGRVIVLDDPSLDAPVDGAVLVCRVTDPGWLPLMLRCAALVTERGGPLSHAAIVARELSLPTVVGAPDAVQIARDATHADVDGSQGSITFRGEA